MSPVYERIRRHKDALRTAIGLMFLLFVGCKASNDIFTIGIAAWDTRSGQQHLVGFKDAMARMNYIEGQNVEYIFEAIPKDKLYDIQFIESKLKMLLAEDLDLLLVHGQEVTDRARVLSQGTHLPILFSGNATPVESGFVNSLDHPGGNMTGVRFANSVPKALEWLVSIGGVNKIYLPYNPNDEITLLSMRGLEAVADRLGVTLILQEVYSVEEAVAAIEVLPEDIDAIYRIPSPTLDLRNSELSRAAIKKGLPMCAPIALDDAVLATFANDEYSLGEKLARLAQQIEKGANPSELPVETAEVFLTINLKTAEQIGLNLPDDIIVQAKRIIR